MNSLPTAKPAMGTIIPKGNYIATIVKAEMKQPKDENRPMYYSAETDVIDPVSGASMGKFWISLYESEAPLILYQIRRFIDALELPLTGDFELRDLTKITVGKKLRVDITPEERKDGKPAQRSVVDISGECFYPINNAVANAAEEVFGGDTPFVPDAAPQTAAPVMSSY